MDMNNHTSSRVGANRIRLTAEIVEATRAAVGDRFILGVRLSEANGFRDGLKGSATPLTKLARQVTTRPVVANGGLGDAALAEVVISGGYADLVSIGRARPCQSGLATARRTRRVS